MRLFSTLVIAGICAAASGCGGDAQSADPGTGDPGVGGSGATGAGGSGDTGDGGSGDSGEGGSGAGDGGSGDTGDGGSATGGSGNPGTDACWSTLLPGNNELATTLTVSGTLNCEHKLALKATGGSVCAADDGSGGFHFTVESVSVEDIPALKCGTGILSADVGLQGVSLVNGGNRMEVVVGKLGGPMAGNQTVLVNGSVVGVAMNNPIGPLALDNFSGALPEGDVSFGADDTTVTYDDANTVVGTASPQVDVGFPVTVNIELKGMKGSLTFAE